MQLWQQLCEIPGCYLPSHDELRKMNEYISSQEAADIGMSRGEAQEER